MVQFHRNLVLYFKTWKSAAIELLYLGVTSEAGARCTHTHKGYILHLIWYRIYIKSDMSCPIIICSDFHQLNNDTDLGMKSAIGLKPPKISAKELTSPVKGKYLISFSEFSPKKPYQR